MNIQKTGKYIVKLRKGKEWTQLQLAEQLSVSPQAVSKWENGVSDPSTSNLIELAKLFQISAEELLNEVK